MTRTVERLLRKVVHRGEPQAEPSNELRFTIALHEDELDGGYYAEVLELPGCVSEGDTYEETMANVVDAIAEVLATRLAPQIEAPRVADGSDYRRVSTRLAYTG